MVMNVLLAGDNFIRNELLAEAIRDRVPTPPHFSSLTLPWPESPFGRVDEVDEAVDCEDDIAEAIGTAEVVITQMAPLTARVLERADRLRLAICTRGGPVNVNVRAAAQRGIAVSCTPGRNAVAAAEYTLLLILAALRRLPEAHGSLVAGEWRSRMYDYTECGGEVAGATVGIVGLGEIGRRVAMLVGALGATVLGYDPFVQREHVAGSVDLLPLEDLLDRSDIVTLHARLTPDSQGLISTAQIERMRRGSVLVNSARGGLLDYRAAATSLERGHLGALALDVFPDEPLQPESPLLKLSHLVVSPHLAGATRQTAARAAAMAAAEVERYAHGRRLLHVVNGVSPERLP